MQETPSRYALGAFREPTTYQLGDDIPTEEGRELEEAIASLSRLAPSFQYQLLERNFVNFKGVHEFVTITLSLGREFASPDRRQLAGSVMTATVNWLTSMRLYLDHQEVDIKRRFGNPSDQSRAFDAATTTAFDGHLGYRFAYKFRNYVQHCGLPLSKVELTGRAPPGTRAKQTVDLLVDRDELLSSFDGWGAVRRDIERMPESFEITPLVQDAMDGLREVHRACTELHIDLALDRCQVIVDAVERIRESHSEGVPVLFRYQGDLENIHRMSPSLIPVHLARALADVAADAAPRESLWSGVDEARPPPFDPATVRARFRRDSRGVQVLSAWFAEGGGSPVFLDVVNRILAEDRSAEPLITGLVNVSAILAHMTAGAIGASAESLVAGLLHIYGDYNLDDPDT